MDLMIGHRLEAGRRSEYYIYTIDDLLCQNGFIRAIQGEVSDVRCNEKSISSKRYQQYYFFIEDFSSDVSEVNITSC